MVGRGLQVSFRRGACFIDAEKQKPSGVGQTQRVGGTFPSLPVLRLCLILMVCMHASGHAGTGVLAHLRTVSWARPCFLARADAAP